MAKAKNLQWGSANRPKVSNKLGIPIPVEGSDGDIQIRQTNAGPKLFAKLGGVWNNTFLSKESDVLSIRDNKGVSRISLSATGDADFHGTLKITGYGGMIDFQGGRDNVILGSSSKKPLANLVNSSDNVSNFAVGNNCMNSTIHAQNNVSIGEGAMQNIGQNSSDNHAANGDNVAVGFNAMKGYSSSGSERTSGSANVVIGKEAGLHWNKDEGTTGADGCVVIGYHAGFYNSGHWNVYLGNNAGYGNSTDGSNGYNNVGIGIRALEDIKDGIANTGLGYNAGDSIVDGDLNVAIGALAGDSVTDGSYNIAIGPYSDNDATTNEQIAIGDQAVTTGQYGIAIGNNISAATNDAVMGKNGNTITCDFDADGTWTQSSDIRKKTNIQDDTLGLAFINDLKTKTFQWKPANEHPEEWSNFSVDEDGNKTYVDINTDIIMHGLIAQEVKESLDKVNCSTFGGWKLRIDGQQELAKASFVTPLIKAVQELSAKVDAMQVEINNLK